MTALARGRRYESRRFEHERTGEPLSAYVVGDYPLDAYVVEQARRDWDARPYRGSAGNPTRRAWWEVRRQGSNLRPGCSIGRFALFTADTLAECLAWIEAQS